MKLKNFLEGISIAALAVTIPTSNYAMELEDENNPNNVRRSPTSQQSQEGWSETHRSVLLREELEEAYARLKKERRELEEQQIMFADMRIRFEQEQQDHLQKHERLEEERRELEEQRRELEEQRKTFEDMRMRFQQEQQARQQELERQELERQAEIARQEAIAQAERVRQQELERQEHERQERLRRERESSEYLYSKIPSAGVLKDYYIKLYTKSFEQTISSAPIFYKQYQTAVARRPLTDGYNIDRLRRSISSYLKLENYDSLAFDQFLQTLADRVQTSQQFERTRLIREALRLKDNVVVDLGFDRRIENETSPQEKILASQFDMVERFVKEYVEMKYRQREQFPDIRSLNNRIIEEAKRHVEKEYLDQLPS